MKLRLGFIIAIACAVALALVFQGGSADPLAALDNSQTQWLCKACSYSFLLTAREVAQRADSDPHHWAPLLCPQCKKKQAYLAIVCPKCRTVYVGRDVPGESGQCPQCAPPTRRASVPEGNRPAAGSTTRPDGSAARSKPAAKVR